MKRLKWLVPGMRVKRWIILLALSVALISMGCVIMIVEDNPNTKAGAGLVILLGIFGVISGVKNVVKSLIAVFLPQDTQRKSELVDIIYQKRYLERGSNVVVMGGGTGLSVLLHGLKN